jgi:hypothetical protein
MTSRSRRDYTRRRARQIAYGRWQPWADVAPVREHLQRLRRAGASYRAIARAADVSPRTVHRIYGSDPTRGRATPKRIHARHAQRLLCITTDSLHRTAVRREAIGARRRLRALIAIGHPAVSLARRLNVPPSVVWGIMRGTTSTVSPAMHTAVCDLYDQLWDMPPQARTPAERRAVAAARTRAARQGWSTPMGLDDDKIDNPAYKPRTRWRPAIGSDP